MNFDTLTRESLYVRVMVFMLGSFTNWSVHNGAM